MKLLKLSMNINHKTAFLQFSVKTDILIRTQIRVIRFRSGKLNFTCIWIWKINLGPGKFAELSHFIVFLQTPGNSGNMAVVWRKTAEFHLNSGQLNSKRPNPSLL